MADTSRTFGNGIADDVAGLLHLRAREYEPDTGRFTTVDPVTPPLGDPLVATYVYGRNRPGVLADPAGTCWWNPLDGSAQAGCPGANGARATIEVVPHIVTNPVHFYIKDPANRDWVIGVGTATASAAVCAGSAGSACAAVVAGGFGLRTANTVLSPGSGDQKACAIAFDAGTSIIGGGVMGAAAVGVGEGTKAAVGTFVGDLGLQTMGRLGGACK